MNPTDITQHIAVLTMDTLRLAIPQSDIISVDVVADAKPDDSGNPLVSSCLHRQDGQWPVYAFSGSLKLVKNIPESCRFCICIKHDDIFYALACESIEVTQLDAETQIVDIPDIMKTDKTPVIKLMQYQQDIALIVNALSINHYLESLGARDV